MTARNNLRNEWREHVKYSLEKSNVVKALRKKWIATEKSLELLRAKQKKWTIFLATLKYLLIVKKNFDVASENYKKHRDMVYFLQLFIVKFQRHMKLYKGPKFGQRLMLDTKMACLYPLTGLGPEMLGKAHKVIVNTLVHYQVLSSKLSKFFVTARRVKRVQFKWREFLRGTKEYKEDLTRVWNESVNLYFLQMKKGELEKISGNFLSVKLQFSHEYLFGEIRDKAIENYTQKRVAEHWIEFNKFRKKLKSNRKKLKAMEAIDAILSKEEKKPKEELEEASGQTKNSKVSEEESEEDSDDSDYEAAALGKDFKFRRRMTVKKMDKIKKVTLEVPKLFVIPDHTVIVKLMRHSVQLEMAEITNS